MKPYWKSKSHIAIFIVFVTWHVLTFAAFIVDMVFYLKEPQPVDPNGPTRITTFIFVLIFLLSFFPDLVFFYDLFRYIRIKRRLANKVESNVEIYTESAGKEAAKAEADKMLRRNEIIANITENANPNDVLYEFKQDINKIQSPKGLFPTFIFAAGLPILAIFVMLFAFLLLFFIMMDVNNPLQGLMNAATITVLTILIFVVLVPIFYIINRVKAKKNPPKEVGIRIYDEYVEQYTVSNKEVVNETRYKVAFDKMKRMSTKSYYLLKGKVNRQIAVIIIDKKDAPEEGLILIEDKYQKAKAAKKANK